MKVVVLNGYKVNYDGNIDYSVLSDEVVVYNDSKPEEILPRCEGAEVIVTKELVLTPEQVAALPASVKLICEAGTGYNNIPLPACREKGIMVCNIPAYSSERVAHTAVMLMLMLASRMQVQMAMLAKGDRSNFTDHLMVSHTELNGKTLGVIGAGHIGGTVIKIAKALDMNILVYTRTPKEDSDGIRYCSLDEVLAGADYLTLHCPLNDKTRHLINEETIAKMKPTACIINTGRGALIDEPALIKALQEGRLAGAGLDVQETEPPVADNPLYTMPEVIITPHMGWKGYETRMRLLDILKADIDGYRTGKIVNRVDNI